MTDLKALRTAVQDLRILVVDDEPEIRASVVEFMGKFFHHVDAAANGAEALQLYQQALAQNQAFDVILSDIKMPVMNGWELMHALKQSSSTAFLALMTGSEEEAGVIDQHPDCDVLLFKPINIDTLVGFLNQLLDSRGLR